MLTSKYRKYGHLLNYIYKDQMVVAVFDRNVCKMFVYFSTYRTYPVYKYSRLCNVSVFSYNSSSVTGILRSFSSEGVILLFATPPVTNSIFYIYIYIYSMSVDQKIIVRILQTRLEETPSTHTPPPKKIFFSPFKTEIYMTQKY